MAKTRLFRNGHSQAVRIPAELAYEHNNPAAFTAYPGLVII